MQREPVSSDALRSIGYDPQARVLEIEFTSGAVYRYLDVPEPLHLGLMQADSHGRFYVENIREAGFDYVQIT